MGEVVGRVAALWRFPVKSMAGEPLAEAVLGWRGIGGDRQYAFLHRGSPSRFPWFTARGLSDLVRYHAEYADPGDPKRSAVTVRAPDGAGYPIDAAELIARLEEESGSVIDLIRSGRGLYDSMPVSVVTTATHAAIDAARGHPVDPRRFRINIVVDSDVRENAWGERTLAFGAEGAGPRLIVHAPIDRCVMITIDPDTGARSPGILKTVVRGFENHVGMHASAVREGLIRVGDAVRIVG